MSESFARETINQIKEKLGMSEEQQGPEQFAHDTERKLRDRIEQLERELVVAIEVLAESGRKRGEAEAILAYAKAYLQKISRHANRSCSAIAARALAELEKIE